jgi:hypothetical protein
MFVLNANPKKEVIMSQVKGENVYCLKKIRRDNEIK